MLREQHSKLGLHRQAIVTMGFLEQRTFSHRVPSEGQVNKTTAERWIPLTFPEVRAVYICFVYASAKYTLMKDTDPTSVGADIHCHSQPH